MPRLLLVLFALAAAGCSAAPRATQDHATATHDAPAVHSPAPPELVTLEVGGMTCSGCVARVQQSLAKVEGVHRVDVNLDTQKATVLADSGVADTALTAAVRRAGSEFLGIVVGR